MAKQKYDKYVHLVDKSVVEAVQFFDNVKTILKLSKFVIDYPVIINYADRKNPLIKVNNSSDTYGKAGDFVIKHDNGKYSIWDKELFLQTYSRISEAE